MHPFDKQKQLSDWYDTNHETYHHRKYIAQIDGYYKEKRGVSRMIKWDTTISLHILCRDFKIREITNYGKDFIDGITMDLRKFHIDFYEIVTPYTVKITIPKELNHGNPNRKKVLVEDLLLTKQEAMGWIEEWKANDPNVKNNRIKMEVIRA